MELDRGFKVLSYELYYYNNHISQTELNVGKFYRMVSI